MAVSMCEGAQLLQPACHCRSKAVLPRDVGADYEVLGGLQLVGPVCAPQLLHLQVDTTHGGPSWTEVACLLRYLLRSLF